jgi:hypothetical protein
MDTRRRMIWRTVLFLCGASLLLAGCGRGPDEREAPPPPPKDSQPAPRAAQVADGEDDPFAGVTPMPERVAVLGLLNKRNGLVREISLKPGESIRIGRAVVRVRACERTAQWESPQETGAFVQLIVLDHAENQWRRVFSGWLFRERPERNVIEHPIYDVFVRSCTMQWPGELDAADIPDVDAEERPASRSSSAPQRPAAPAAAPAPTPRAPDTPEPSGDANAEAAEDTAG